MRRKIQTLIDELRPMLQADGGDVEFIDYVDGVVKLRLKGACACCPMATMTLKAGIERRLKEELPEIDRVEQVL